MTQETLNDLAEKLEKAIRLSSTTAENIEKQEIRGKNFSHSERERVANLIKIFAQERINDALEKIKNFGVDDDI